VGSTKKKKAKEEKGAVSRKKQRGAKRERGGKREWVGGRTAAPWLQQNRFHFDKWEKANSRKKNQRKRIADGKLNAACT